MSKSKKVVYKAQWPLSTNKTTPEVLIYPDKTRSPFFYLPATPEVRKELFRNTFIRVYFEGRIVDKTVNVDKFVREDEWI